MTWRGPHCTAECRQVERWSGATLYSRRVIHSHGERCWGGYDAQTLGLGCGHADDQACAARREPVNAGAL